MNICETRSRSMSDLIAHQWGRLGDLIQTGVVLSRWKSQTSGRVALTYDSRYQAVVERMSCVDDGFPLDLSRIVGDSRSERECETILTIEQALNGMQSLCGGVHLVLNRSNSVALLSHLLKPEVSIGYRWDNGQLRTPAILADWLNGPDENPYPAHVCDTWSQMAGLSCDSIPGDVLFGKKANRKTDPKAFRILLVADAGETYRTLPTPWLAGLCRELLKLPQLHITAVGSKTGNGMDKLNSLAASNEYQFEDLRGRTTLMELISLCERHDAAIGPDTGGLHLAAACGCFPIGLYSGGASVFNTGPYSARACVLQNPEWT
ncbi:hypothetical protein EH220_08460, partial [bacterium]